MNTFFIAILGILKFKLIFTLVKFAIGLIILLAILGAIGMFFYSRKR